MIRKQLKQMPRLYATKTLMEMASKEKMPDDIEYGRRMLGDSHYLILLRCDISGGILHVAVFYSRDLRLKSRKPLYDIYIDKGKKQYITWDNLNRKWVGAKIYHLSELDYPFFCDSFSRHGRFYISKKDDAALKEYLGTQKGSIWGIREYQDRLGNERLAARRKRETDEWDKMLSGIPALPKDWAHWVDKYGIRDNYIFYTYTRNKNKEGYCTWCERQIPIINPRHNRKGICPRCRHDIVYKAIGKSGRFRTNAVKVYLIQRMNQGFVIRQFLAYRNYVKGEYRNPEYSVFEENRVIYPDCLHGTVFSWARYKDGSIRWIKGEFYRKSFGYWYFNDYYCGLATNLYPRNLAALEKTVLRQTALVQMLRKGNRFDLVKYMTCLVKYPCLEQIVKAGLDTLANDILSGKQIEDIADASELAKVLGLDNFRLKRLKRLNGGTAHLYWLQHEKKEGKLFHDELIQAFISESILPSDMDFILNRMSEVKILHYLEKQSQLVQIGPKQLLSTWRDYLSMAEKLHMDVEKELFYKPKNLVISHNLLSAECRGVSAAAREKEVLQEYPDVNAICQSVAEKYTYIGEDFRIVAPMGVRDIVREGIALGHCLHSSDTYFARIQRRESYILFLRRNKEPELPFYTLEIEPDGTTRQKRTTGDQQGEDYEEARSFIVEWQKIIQKRLSAEDRMLAKVSSALREKEFEDLREKKTRIRGGHLAGKLLVEVLEADLMLAEQMVQDENDVRVSEGEALELIAA